MMRWWLGLAGVLISLTAARAQLEPPDTASRVQSVRTLLAQRVAAIARLQDATRGPLSSEVVENLYEELRFPRSLRGMDSDEALVSTLLPLVLEHPESRSALRTFLLQLYAESPLAAPPSTDDSEAVQRTVDLVYGIEDHIGVHRRNLETYWLMRTVRDAPEVVVLPPIPHPTLMELGRTGAVGVQKLRALRAVAEAHALHLALLSIKRDATEAIVFLNALGFHQHSFCTTQALKAAGRSLSRGNGGAWD